MIKLYIRYAVFVLLALPLQVVSANTSSACLASMVYMQSGSLYLKPRVSWAPEKGVQDLYRLNLSQECLSASFSQIQVRFDGGRIAFLEAVLRRGAGVVIHELDSKAQLSLYAQLTREPKMPAYYALSFLRNDGVSFRYHLHLLGSEYQESISWGEPKQIGD